MNRDDFALLFQYDRWAWERVLTKAALVTPDQYVALAPTPHGSLRGTLVHALSAQLTWRRRLDGDSPTAPLNELDLPDFPTLQARWESEAHALQTTLGQLTDADLQKTLHYKTMKGAPMANVLWQILAHVVNHGTAHRSEAAMLLTSFGYSPGDLDLIVFLRESR